MSSVIRRYGNKVLNLTHFEQIICERKSLMFYGRQTRLGGLGMFTHSSSQSHPTTIEFNTPLECNREFDLAFKALEEYYINLHI